MSNDLEIREQSSIVDIENTQRLCKTLMQQAYFKKIGEEGVFAILLKAKSLNINPIDALGGLFYYVQGKVGMSSEMMATLIRQAGHSIIKDPKSDNNNCILHGKRTDNGDTWTVSFSMDDARRAGLAKNMYDKYPGVMLYNRALSMLARQLFPDVIKGCGYTPDELNEIKDSKNSSLQKETLYTNVEVVEEKKEENISEELATEIAYNISLSSDEFKKKMFEWLRIIHESALIEAIKAKPMAVYEALSNRCKKAASEYQESLNQEVVA